MLTIGERDGKEITKYFNFEVRISMNDEYGNTSIMIEFFFNISLKLHNNKNS